VDAIGPAAPLRLLVSVPASGRIMVWAPAKVINHVREAAKRVAVACLIMSRFL
jgi:hypothetical protein